ncbi:MAG: PEP-CTERM sorting domain-containing protein [Planctomycetota bacterium]
MTRLTACLVAITALALGKTAVAQPDYVGTLSESVYTFEVDFGVRFSNSRLEADFPIANYVFDYNTVDEVQVSITAQAPAGQMFVITPPTGFDSELRLTLSGGGGIGAFSNASIDVQSPGGPSLQDSATLVIIGADQAGVSASANFVTLTPGLTYYATSITVTGTAPLELNDSVDAEFTLFELSGAAFTSDLNTPDPGPWVTLQPIPEPASLALTGIIGAVLIMRRRSAA